MRIISAIAISIVLLGVIVLAGCSSNKDTAFQGRPDGEFPRDRVFRSMNISDEERQAMMEQRQQNMIESCSGMNEGDVCIIENPKGEMEGTCKMVDEDLICRMDMPENMPNREMRPR